MADIDGKAESPEPEDVTLVALTPSALPATQQALIAWCERKAAAVRTAADDLRTNLEIAKRNKWKHTGLAAAFKREEKRVLFYTKIKEAVAAGYLIIPNFPIDAFAVRVDPETARSKSATWLSDHLLDVTPHQLPTGEGEYVNDRREYETEPAVTDTQGKVVQKEKYTVHEYDMDIDLPFILSVKPLVVEATERAMALKIFDRLGVVRQRKRDPIIVGQLVDPREKYPNHASAQVVTFFIAWWLDTATL